MGVAAVIAVLLPQEPHYDTINKKYSQMKILHILPAAEYEYLHLQVGVMDGGSHNIDTCDKRLYV